MLFTFQVLGAQYALTVVTKYKGNNDKSVSHVSLYKSKNLCSDKLNDINLLFSNFISSFILSKINTFASTAIPTVNIIPAIPGKVSVASKIDNIPISNIKFDISATLAIRPNILYL